MRLSICVLTTAGALALAAAWAAPAPAQNLTPQQTKQVEDIVRRVIKENPRVILEAIEDLRKEEQAAAKSKAVGALKSRREQIERDPATPVAGNPQGDVTVVEFFDYRCPYCKAAHERVKQVVAKDGKIRLVLKEFPILGPDSVFAARAALAARRQDPGKYYALHDALLSAKERLNNELTLKIAADAGFDVERLKRDMAAPEISRMLEANADLAEELGINGTPAFIVGDNLAPGAIDAATLERLVAEARKAK
ncbi:MAG: DsbA family protein [Rhodospirillales bacterium]